MFHLDTLATLVAATLTLLLGRKLVHSVSFLKKYTIPEPVAGGLLVEINRWHKCHRTPVIANRIHQKTKCH